MNTLSSFSPTCYLQSEAGPLAIGRSFASQSRSLVLCGDQYRTQRSDAIAKDYYGCHLLTQTCWRTRTVTQHAVSVDGFVWGRGGVGINLDGERCNKLLLRLPLSLRKSTSCGVTQSRAAWESWRRSLWAMLGFKRPTGERHRFVQSELKAKKLSRRHEGNIEGF